MNYKPYKHLPPFKGMVLQNFPFIEEDFDAITNYGLLCKVVEYLRNVIANELTMEENVTNLYNEFVNLKNYIDNYFETLDVQEEINNKLDEMTESGELTQLIGAYVTPYIDEQNSRLNTMQTQINSIASGSPLVASSISDMTNTSKVYVNTTDGYWYYYNGTAWVRGGIYQSTGIANDYLTPFMLNNNVKDIINTRIPNLTIIDGEYVRFNNTISEKANTYRSEPFLLKKGETIVLSAKGYVQNVGMISECNLSKTLINIVAMSIDSTLRTYTYTALHDTYIMISYLPGDTTYYIYNNKELEKFNNINYDKTEYNSLLINDDINYRLVEHDFKKYNTIYPNETEITVDTDSSITSGWNWSVFKKFNVSNFNDGTYKVSGILDIKNTNDIELFILKSNFTTIKRTVIPASNEYKRVIISEINPASNDTIIICIGSQKEEPQQNTINIRLLGLFINQEDTLIYNNPLTFNDIKYLLQTKNVYNYSSFSIIGDSYSAYKGWIPSDGRWSWYKPEGNTGENNVSSVTQMWWYLLANMINSTLLYLDGWSGSTICTTGQDGADVSNSAMVNRAETSLGANRVLQPKPSLIFIFGGTNDSWMNSPVGDVKYSNWTEEDIASVLPAFCKMVDTIKTYNPGARIINLINDDIKSSIKDGMKIACEHYNIDCLELTNVSKQTGHPNINGMKSIANQIFNIL